MTGGSAEPDRYVCFDEVKDNAESVLNIKWAQIKSANRAIEKIVRAYKQVRTSSVYLRRI